MVQLSSPEKVENLVPDQSNPSGEPDKVNVDVEETDAIESQILKCPEIWDPYGALALYMFIQRRRAIEAPARSSMSTPTATEILDDDEEEPQATWGLQKAGQPGPSRPRVRERCRVSNSKFTLEIIEARTLQAYSNSLPAAEIPIPGKLSSRLLDIGWITKAEAQANFLPIDWEALEWYHNREEGPYPYIVLRIPKRQLPPAERRQQVIQESITKARELRTVADPCLDTFENEIMTLDVEDPPVATRAGIWVYEDGGIVDASKRASRELFMCSCLRTDPNSDPDKPENYQFPSRLNAYEYLDKTPIPDGLGDDIPTEEDREAIFRARIAGFDEGRWGYSWICLQFAEMMRKGMSRREARRMLVLGRPEISRVESSPLEKRIDDWREGTTTEKRLHEEDEEGEDENGDWDMLSSFDSEDGHRKKRQRI